MAAHRLLRGLRVARLDCGDDLGEVRDHELRRRLVQLCAEAPERGGRRGGEGGDERVVRRLSKDAVEREIVVGGGFRRHALAPRQRCSEPLEIAVRPAASTSSACLTSKSCAYVSVRMTSEREISSPRPALRLRSENSATR